MFYVGLDLGQRSDYTALAVIEAPVFAREPIWTVDEQNHVRDERGGWMPPANVSRNDWPMVRPARRDDRQSYALRHLVRYPLGTPYPDIIASVHALLQLPPLAGRCALLVDATGVGRPVVDQFKAAGIEPYAITITGGDAVAQTGNEVRVPKRDLAMAVQLLLQQRRLSFAAALPLLDVLRKELQAFEVKIDPRTAHDSYLSWRDGAHDDLVLAVAMAAWAADADPPVVYGSSFAFAYDLRHALGEWRG